MAGIYNIGGIKSSGGIRKSSGIASVLSVAGPGLLAKTLPGGQVSLTPARSPSRIKRARPAPLSLTTRPHPEYVPPKPDTFTGTRWWVYPGSVDRWLATNFKDPIELTSTSGSKFREVWLKVGWEGEFTPDAMPVWTSVEVKAEEPDAPRPVWPERNTKDNPGKAGPGLFEYYIIPIGRVNRVFTQATPPVLVEQAYHYATGHVFTNPTANFSSLVMGDSLGQPPRIILYHNLQFLRHPS